MATLFIGMPVYNGERFIGQALETLIHQTYTDWTLLISSNDSQDGTASICEEYCRKDDRIRYVKQDRNIGAIDNFKFLLQSAGAPFFMWAAADDEWEPQFLETCVNGLENTPDAGLAFCNIVNIDSFSQIIREYPSFKMFVHDDPFARVASYLLAPEFLGKANLFYSVYRLTFIKDYFLKFIPLIPLQNPFSDVSLIFGALCRSNIVIDERVLFKKRVERQTDQFGKPDLIATGLPYLNAWSQLEMNIYFADMRRVGADTPYAELIESLVNYRANLNQAQLDSKKTTVAVNTNSPHVFEKIKRKMTTFIGMLRLYWQRLRRM